MRAYSERGLPKILITSILLFLFFSIIYASLAPNIFQQDWDSLMYAYRSEVDGIKAIWGNHPLGHALLNSSYIFLSKLGYVGKALPVYIFINSIFGGMSVAVLFIILTRIIEIDYLHSVGYALIFGASYSLWHYSGSADIYSLSILTLLMAWASLLYEVLLRNHRYIYSSGFFAGLSVLSHQLNAVFIFAAIFVILCQRKNLRLRLLSFYTSTFVIIIAGTFLFGYFATSSLNFSAIFEWTRGYVGDPLYGSYLKFESLPIAWKTALSTVLIPTSGRSNIFRILIYMILIGSVVLGATQFKLLDWKKLITLLAALVQCLVSWFLIVWFEPFYPKFWLLTLVPCMLFFSCSMSGLQTRYELSDINYIHSRKLFSYPLVFLGLFVLLFNYKYAVFSEHKPDVLSQEALDSWLRHSDQNDMLITSGDLIPQLWFWADRSNAVHLYHYLEVDQGSVDRFAHLRSEIDRFICDGNYVIFAPEIVDNFHTPFLKWLNLSRDDLRIFFDAYSKEEYFTYNNTINGKETQVYRLLSLTECDD